MSKATKYWLISAVLFASVITILPISSSLLAAPSRSGDAPTRAPADAGKASVCTNKYGDITGDGKVNIFDVACYQRYLTQASGVLPSCMKVALECADIDCDNQITIGEASLDNVFIKTGNFGPVVDKNKNAVPDCKEVPATPKLQCGDTIATSTTMTEDLLDCPNTGLHVKGKDTILDCNGHMISAASTSFYASGIYVNSKYSKYTNFILKNCQLRILM